MTRRFASKWAGVALVTMLLSGTMSCGDSLTQIILEIDSEYGRSDTGPMQVQVIGASGDFALDQSIDFSLPGAPESLPITFGLVLAGDAQGNDVEVRVTAPSVAGGGSVAASARTAFVNNSTRVLSLSLTRACADVMCDAAQTCVAGTCENNFVPGDSLPSR